MIRPAAGCGRKTPMPAGVIPFLQRLAEALDRRRILAYCRILLAIEAALFLFLVAGTHGWIVPLKKPTTTDFVSFYAAGSLADAGTPALAYDQAAHYAAEEQATAAGIRYQFFYYPPVYLLLCAVLARLPYLVAFVTFEAITLGLYLFVACRILGERSIAVLVPLLAFPATFWTLGLGQNAFLTAALMGGGTLLVDRRPLVAGLLFGALCYKPHFGLLVPVALAAGGHWRAFAAAAATVAALCLASLLLFGAETWHAFLAGALLAHGTYESGRILFAGFASPFGAVLLLGGKPVIAYAVQMFALLAMAGLMIWVWRRSLPLPLRAAVLSSAAIIAVPIVLLYDIMLGTIAAVWLLRDSKREGLRYWEKLMLAGLYLVLLDGRNLADWHLPVIPAAALVLVLIVAARARREAHRAAPGYGLP